MMLVEPTRRESCPSRQYRRPAALREEKFLSRDHKSFLVSTTPKTKDEDADPPGRYRFPRCGNVNRIDGLLIRWGSWSHRAARVSPRDNVEVPPIPREASVLCPDQTSFYISITNLSKLGTKSGILRVEYAPHVMEPPTTLAGW